MSEAAKPKSRPGRKPFVPTAEQRADVEKYAAVGTPQDVIAEIIGISDRTLREKFPDELKHGMLRINARIGGRLASKALEGDNACIFFWMKTRAGWRDVSLHEHTGRGGGPIQTVDMVGLVAGLTPEERKAAAPVIDKLIAAAMGGDDGAPGEAD